MNFQNSTCTSVINSTVIFGASQQNNLQVVRKQDKPVIWHGKHPIIFHLKEAYLKEIFSR